MVGGVGGVKANWRCMHVICFVRVQCAHVVCVCVCVCV